MNTVQIQSTITPQHAMVLTDRRPFYIPVDFPFERYVSTQQQQWISLLFSLQTQPHFPTLAGPTERRRVKLVSAASEGRSSGRLCDGWTPGSSGICEAVCGTSVLTRIGETVIVLQTHLAESAAGDTRLQKKRFSDKWSLLPVATRVSRTQKKSKFLISIVPELD